MSIGDAATDEHGIRVIRAAKRNEFCAAFQLLYECYTARGLGQPHPFGLRLTRHHLRIGTSVLLAQDNERRSVGTLSLVEDGNVRIPMRLAFAREVDDLAASGARIAEVTSLAVRDATSRSASVVHRLMGFVAQLANHRGVERLLIAVHPRHAAFYVRAAGFHHIGGVRPYASVGGLPAVALQLNLKTLAVDAPAVYRRYFGMQFPLDRPRRVSIAPTTQAWLTSVWQQLHGGDAGSREIVMEQLKAS
jgi:hypothetical protein